MLGDYWVPNREHIVTYMKQEFMKTAMANGYNIVVDNMNLNPKELAWYKTIVASNESNYKYEIEYKDFFIPVEECIRRDAMRSNPIGERVIKDTWRRYRNFIIQENIKKTLANRPKHIDGGHYAIIVDLDATLCFNTSGRPFFGPGAAEGMLTDEPITEVIDLVKRMYEHTKVIIVTGREGTDEIVSATKEWLTNNGIKFDEIYFRPQKSYISGAECKRKIYLDNIKGKYNIKFVLEDNYKCVEMWREQGLVCLQPNDGQF